MNLARITAAGLLLALLTLQLFVRAGHFPTLLFGLTLAVLLGLARALWGQPLPLPSQSSVAVPPTRAPAELRPLLLAIEVAGMAWVEENKPFIAKGPSGIAVRTLVEFVRGFAHSA